MANENLLEELVSRLEKVQSDKWKKKYNVRLNIGEYVTKVNDLKFSVFRSFLQSIDIYYLRVYGLGSNLPSSFTGGKVERLYYKLLAQLGPIPVAEMHDKKEEETLNLILKNYLLD